MKPLHGLIAVTLVAVLAGAGFAIWKLLSGRKGGAAGATPPPPPAV